MISLFSDIQTRLSLISTFLFHPRYFYSNTDIADIQTQISLLCTRGIFTWDMTAIYMPIWLKISLRCFRRYGCGYRYGADADTEVDIACSFGCPYRCNSHTCQLDMSVEVGVDMGGFRRRYRCCISSRCHRDNVNFSVSRWEQREGDYSESKSPL